MRDQTIPTNQSHFHSLDEVKFLSNRFKGHSLKNRFQRYHSIAQQIHTLGTLEPNFCSNTTNYFCIYFFGSLSHKNSIVKRAWLWAILGWVTFWEVSQKVCEWGQSTLKSLVLVCRVSRWSYKRWMSWKGLPTRRVLTGGGFWPTRELCEVP